MKMSFIAPALGACALLTFPACKSTDGDGYAGNGYIETALPMSEVADGEIPPWLLEDDGTNGAHVDAGPRTPALADARNRYPIPDPTEGTAAATATTRQNQPQLAAGQDDAFVETPHPTATGTDPLAAAAISPTTYTPVVHPTESVASTPKKTGRSSSTGKSTTKTASSTGGKKTSSSSAKSGKKPKQPTMVIYKVRPGDNLSEIAKRSNTTVSQIMRDSDLKSTTIRPGQTIKVKYTPKDYKDPKKDAKGSKTGSKAGKGGQTHTITSGQTLSGIAKRYGVTTSELMKANGLKEADAKKIRPGQELSIPSKSKSKSKR